MVAQIGGFLGRKGDGDPGATVLWRGLDKLAFITDAFRIFHPTLSSRIIPSWERGSLLPGCRGTKPFRIYDEALDLSRRLVTQGGKYDGSLTFTL